MARSILTIALLGVCLLAACAQRAAPQAASVPGSAQSVEARGPKNLTIAIQAEPAGMNQYLTTSRTGNGNTQPFLIAHNYLVVRNDQGTNVPQVAAEIISTQDGTWQINPDGTMDTTWKIRPNVMWQDGVPFTADDLVFSLGVYKDPAVPSQVPPVVKPMASAEAPDPATFIVHWSSIDADADQAAGLVPIPRHLVGDAYENDKANFVSNPYFGSQFVGLGPYRLARWDPGVQMELTRFDAYFLGRPPLDSITIKFQADANAMVAGILAGSTDIVLPTGVEIEVAKNVMQQWEGTGNQVLIAPDNNVRYLEMQDRPEYVRPANGFTVRLVRQAFSNATNRQALAEIATGGASPPADNWFPPTDALYNQVEPAVPQYPYDLNLAQQRLAQAGWGRDADGRLISQTTGERFDVEVRSLTGNAADKQLAAIADGWQAVGAQVETLIVPAALSSDAEYRLTFPGASLTGHLTPQFYSNMLDSRLIAGPSNHWSAANRTGYANPVVDELYDKLTVTIDPAARVELHKALLQEVLGDAAIIPLYWQYNAVLALKGVHGIGGMMDNSNTWNVFTWTKD